MDSLKAAQAELYEMLKSFGAPCLLRTCSTSDALWVCDLPRRLADAEGAKQSLADLGVRCTADEDSLWRLDWTLDKYRELADELPIAAPPLPKAVELHEAYALCRLLLRHPAPIEAQPLAAVREALKLPQQPPTRRQRIISSLMDDCAVSLREHKPLPTMAGGILANWIQEIEKGEGK